MKKYIFGALGSFSLMRGGLEWGKETTQQLKKLVRTPYSKN